jgi:hypothetical protein
MRASSSLKIGGPCGKDFPIDVECPLAEAATDRMQIGDDLELQMIPVALFGRNPVELWPADLWCQIAIIDCVMLVTDRADVASDCEQLSDEIRDLVFSHPIHPQPSDRYLETRLRAEHAHRSFCRR